jgi:hypothetical protein
MADPSAKVDMDPNFENRLRDLKAQAAQEYEARSRGEQVLWFRPLGPDGQPVPVPPFDWEALAVPFSRQASNDGYAAACADPDAPGVTGDLIAATTMVDYLACLERAYRMRHTMTRPRAVCHLLGRKRGQGIDLGGFGATIQYLRAVLAQARTNT